MPPEPEFRRLHPPSRRRPGPFAVACRWRRELLVAAVLGAGVWAFGAGPTALIVGLAVVATLALPPLRRIVLGGLQSVVVPHRARAGFVQAGVASRAGKLPWITSSRGRGDAVILSMWLPAGVTIGDVDRAREVIAAACGAAEVRLVHRGPRRDRVLLVVLRPRWGWWGR